MARLVTVVSGPARYVSARPDTTVHRLADDRERPLSRRVPVAQVSIGPVRQGQPPRERADERDAGSLVDRRPSREMEVLALRSVPDGDHVRPGAKPRDRLP